MANKREQLKRSFAAAVALVAIVIWIFTYNNLRNSPWEVRAKAARASAHLREVDKALNTYYGANLRLPASTENWSDLTTPVAYLPRMLTDPFSEKSETAIQFVTSGTAFMIFSVGPDEKPDTEPLADFTTDNASITGKTYDATNGTKSAGDIIHIGSVAF